MHMDIVFAYDGAWFYVHKIWNLYLKANAYGFETGHFHGKVKGIEKTVFSIYCHLFS